MLRLGGYLNILIAILHIVGLFWADKMFEVTGISDGMARAAQNIHPMYPYFITVVVAIFFFVFGMYGLSADGKIRKLPFLKPVIFLIAGIYLLRGIGELIFDMEMQQANQILETSYSLIAVLIGLLFLIGGIRKWKK
jgi:heme/copper-type cytochrome/quinol oxidase subunit 3